MAIHNSKTIEKERKPSLHYQNLIGGTAGIVLGSAINNFINKHKELLCKELKEVDIPKVNNIIKGVQIAMPLIIFSALLRFIIPILATPISTYMERYRLTHQNK